MKLENTINTRTLKATFFLLGAMSALANAQSWHFTVDSSKTGLDGSASFQAGFKGNLIGNWDAATNPGGTMTKNGYEGPFGNDENVAVKCEPKLRMGAKVSMKTSGEFDFAVDTGKRTVVVTNFSEDLLAGGPMLMPVQLMPNNRPFKTKNPEGKFKKKESWMNQGNLTVDKFMLTQNGASKNGFFRKSEKSSKVIAWAMVPVHVELNFHEDGGADHPVAFDTYYAVGGQLAVDGTAAVLSTNAEKGKSGFEKDLNKALDPFHVQITGKNDAKGEIILNLSMKKLYAKFEGMRQFVANGVQTP